MNLKLLKKILFGLLFYTVLVIIWGAWVRISHSGDGCGDSWPFCHGEVIPEFVHKKTWVEYAHRAMSGIYGIVVFAIFLWSRKLPKDHITRKWTTWIFIFTISEALLGAKLVLSGLVADNDSPMRAFSMALHLLNSLILVLTVCMAYLGLHWDSKLQLSKKNIALFILIAATGAWASLSTTLFPSESLWQGLIDDFKQDGHFITRLRILHPIAASLIGVYLLKELYVSLLNPLNSAKKKAALWASSAVLAQMFLGFATLLLLSPNVLKMMHLTLAHTSWILLIFWMTAPSVQRDTHI